MGEASRSPGRRQDEDQAGPASQSRRQGGRILVVEDEPDLAAMLRYNLARNDWDVVAAANGAEALRRVRDGRPDVILLDIMVAEVNGWEACRRLRLDPGDPSDPRHHGQRPRGGGRQRAGAGGRR